MTQILDLKDYRKRPALERAAPPADSGPVYYCRRCDTDRLKLSPSSEVRCAHRGALMRNIQVTAEDATVQVSLSR